MANQRSTAGVKTVLMWALTCLMLTQTGVANSKESAKHVRPTEHGTVAHHAFAQQEKNIALVGRAMTAFFVKRDVAAIDDYVAKDYVQHNPHVPNGSAALAGFIKSLPSDFHYEQGLMTAHNDIVMVHGRYRQQGKKPVIAVDIFRIKDGKLVEHWDVLQDEIPAEQTASGNPMFESLPGQM